MDHQSRAAGFKRRDFLKLTGMSTFALTSKLISAQDREPILPFFVGTYTTNTKSEGIYYCKLNYKTGELRLDSITRNVVDPSYLAITPSKRYLYAVNETEEFGGKKSGAISAFAVDKRGGLSLLNQQPSLGASPCYVSVANDGRHILVANYSSGNVAVFPINDNGTIGGATDIKQYSGKSINPDRQEGPHAHCIELDKQDRFAYACDLGADKIMSYRYNPGPGKLTANKVPSISTKPGAGPRHIVIHPLGRYAYVVNELHSTVTFFSRDTNTGDLKEVQTLSALPADFSGPNTSADIHLSLEGTGLFVSNRGHDSIAYFKINLQNGELTYVGNEPTGGKTPRNFALDPLGRFVLVANQNSNNIVVLRRNFDGRLSPSGQSLEIPAPVCLKFY